MCVSGDTALRVGVCVMNVISCMRRGRTPNLRVRVCTLVCEAFESVFAACACVWRRTFERVGVIQDPCLVVLRLDQLRERFVVWRKQRVGSLTCKTISVRVWEPGPREGKARSLRV